MADLAVWQRTIVDEEGNVIPGAEVEVRREEDDSLATIYADRAGETPLANPLAADMSGFVRFFAQGDAYTITAVGAGSTRTWRFDPTGRLQEFDRVSEALNTAGGADTLETRRQLGTFSSVAEVQSRHIPAVLESIRTLGQNVPGDGGGAELVEAQSTNPGARQSADGRWWVPATPQVTAQMFGAKGDARYGSGGGISGASTTFTASGANFSSDDVGKTIHIGGAGEDGLALRTTVVSVTSATTVTVADAAVQTVSGVQWCVGTDDTEALRTATRFLDWRGGGDLVLTPGAYLATGHITDQQQQRVGIRGFGPNQSQLLQRLPPGGANRPLIFWNGSKGPSIAVTAPASERTFTLTVASTAGLAEGDYLLLDDTSQPIIDNLTGDPVGWLGETVRVRSIDGPTQLTLWGGLEASYTDNATIYKLNLLHGNSLRDLKILNPIRGGSGLASRAAYFGYTKSARIKNVEIEGIDDQGLLLVHNVDMTIVEPHFKDMSSDREDQGGGGYGINVSYGNWNILVRGATSEKCRHLVTGGSVGGSENAHIKFVDCMGRENYGAVFDTHPGAGRDWEFENCHAYGPLESPISYAPGFQIRNRRAKVINPTCVNVGVGVYFNTADDQTLIGGTYTDVDYMLRVRGSARPAVLGAMRVIRPRQGLVWVDHSGAAVSEFPGFHLDADIVVEGDPAGPALQFDSWEDNYVINRSRIYAPDVTTLASGVPHWALYGGTALDGRVKFENFPRLLTNHTSVDLLTSGTLFLAGLHIPKGERIRYVSFVGGSGPENQTHQWMAVYDRDLNILARTPDRGSSGTAGLRINTLYDGGFVTPYSGLYYVGLVSVADTPQAIRGIPAAPSSLSQAPILAGHSTAGLTDETTAPAQAGAIQAAGVTTVPWVGVG